MATAEAWAEMLEAEGVPGGATSLAYLWGPAWRSGWLCDPAPDEADPHRRGWWFSFAIGAWLFGVSRRVYIGEHPPEPVVVRLATIAISEDDMKKASASMLVLWENELIGSVMETPI